MLRIRHGEIHFLHVNFTLKKWKTLWFTTVLAGRQIVSSLSCKLSSVTTNFKKSVHKMISHYAKWVSRHAIEMPMQMS